MNEKEGNILKKIIIMVLLGILLNLGLGTLTQVCCLTGEKYPDIVAPEK